MDHLVYKLTLSRAHESNTELSQFVTIFFSLEMEQAVRESGYDWREGVRRLEVELTQRAKDNLIDVRTFSELCYSVDVDVPLTSFLEAIKPKVLHWIGKKEVD